MVASAPQRRVVLVEVFWGRNKDPRVPLGHASLLAALSARTNADIRPVAVARQDLASAEELAELMLNALDDANGPDADLAVGIYVWSEKIITDALRIVRRRGFSGRIVMGGPQISYAPSGVERLYPNGDAFVRGYGEDALCQLVADPGRPPIQGVTYKRGFDTAAIARCELPSLESPWLSNTIPAQGRRFLRWETQRGCPYRCSFCQHREAGSRLAHRALHPARISAEARMFCEARVSEIAVLDPIFNATRHGATADWPLQVLGWLSEYGFEGRLSLQCRAENLDQSFLDACAKLDVNLEFGLQTAVEEEWRPIQRGNKMEKVDAALRSCRERGIRHEVSLIYGLPLQTPSSFERSIQWCLERNVPTIKAFPLVLLRGTRLEKDRQQWALRTDGSALARVVASTTFDTREYESMEKLAQALERSQGQHPRSMHELRELARHQLPTPLAGPSARNWTKNSQMTPDHRHSFSTPIAPSGPERSRRLPGKGEGDA